MCVEVIIRSWSCISCQVQSSLETLLIFTLVTKVSQVSSETDAAHKISAASWLSAFIIVGVLNHQKDTKFVPSANLNARDWLQAMASNLRLLRSHLEIKTAIAAMTAMS